MPVYLKQWRTSDFTLVYATDLDEAVRIFNQTDPVDDETILQLNAADLSVTFTLTDQGELVCREFSPAVEQARSLCCPALVRALLGRDPWLPRHPDHEKVVQKAIDDDVKFRKDSKLDLLVRHWRRSRKATPAVTVPEPSEK